MARVYVSAVMNATLDEAWAYLRDFGALGNYHPYFEKSYIEDGKPSDQVGCVRHFTVRDGGGYLREQPLLRRMVGRMGRAGGPGSRSGGARQRHFSHLLRVCERASRQGQMSATPPTAWVVGTFDTKAAELLYLAGLLRAAGVRVLTVD